MIDVMLPQNMSKIFFDTGSLYTNHKKTKYKYVYYLMAREQNALIVEPLGKNTLIMVIVVWC